MTEVNPEDTEYVTAISQETQRKMDDATDAHPDWDPASDQSYSDYLEECRRREIEQAKENGETETVTQYAVVDARGSLVRTFGDELDAEDRRIDEDVRRPERAPHRVEERQKEVADE